MLVGHRVASSLESAFRPLPEIIGTGHKGLNQKVKVGPRRADAFPERKADGQAGDRMTSAGPTVADPPATAEALPRWLTLREAAFVSGIDEDELQAWVISGNVRCDRSLSRRLGEHYLLVLSEDLVTAGLLEAPPKPGPTQPAPAQPAFTEFAPTEPASAPRSAPAVKPPAPTPPIQPLAPTDVVSITPPEDPVPAKVAEAPIETPAQSAIEPLRETAALAWTTVYPAIRQGLRWVKVGLLLGLLLSASLPLALRYRTFPVTSADMAPALRTGDLMLVRPVAADKIRAGDVVAFRDGARGPVVPVRVKAVDGSFGVIHIETETSATRSVHRWTVARNGSVDLVRYRVSLLGKAISPLPANAMKWVPYGLPGVVFIVLLVVALRMRRRDRGEVPESA
jgi:hypothetical protein